MLEGFASLETDYFQYGPALELASNLTDSTKSWGDVGDSSSRLLGNYLAGLTRYFKPMRDTLAQFDAEERAYREDPKTAQDKFINEVSRSLPGLIRLSHQEKKFDIKGKPVEQQFPIGRVFGVNIANTAFSKNKDSAATEWANTLFPFVGGTEMTPDDRKAASARTAIREAKRSGKSVDIHQALKNMRTELSEGSIARLKDELEYSELGAKIKYSFGDNPKDVQALQTVWSHATDTEKKEIRKVLAAKENVSAKTKALFR